MMPPHKDQTPPDSCNSLAAAAESGRADQAVSLSASVPLRLPTDQGDSLSSRVERYGKARARAVAMLDHLNGECSQAAERAASRLSVCGNYLHFRHYFTAGDVRLHAARFCKQHLVCPLCAIRRGSKTLDAYLQRFEVVRAQRPALRPWLLTFTVRNGPDLLERFEHLADSFQRLQNRRRLWNKGARGAQWTEFARVDGAVGSYEVTNRGNGWHPHLHMVALAPSEPLQAALRAEWQAITGDSFMVDVRPFQEAQDPAAGFMEVMKYALKFGDLSLPDNWHAAQVLRARRLLFSIGCFRGVDVPEELTDEPLEGLPYFDLFYRYFAGLGYVLTGECPPEESAQPGQAPRLPVTGRQPRLTTTDHKGVDHGCTSG